MPKTIIPNLKNTLPCKGVKQDEESDDDEAEFLKRLQYDFWAQGKDAMTKLTNQILKAQEEYKRTNKQPYLPMSKHTEIQRPEDIVPQTYEVRINKRTSEEAKEIW